MSTLTPERTMLPDAPTIPDTQVDGPDSNNPSRRAHIIATKAPADAEFNTADALVTEAHVFGSELVALCGYRFVPSHDPQKYPVCANCRGIAHNLI